MKPSELPTKEDTERRRQPRSDATNNLERGSVSDLRDGRNGSDAAVNGGEQDRGHDGIDSALVGLSNFAAESSDMDSSASTYLERATMNAEHRQHPQRGTTTTSEMLQEGEARRQRVLHILERALEISKEAMDDEDNLEHDSENSSPSD